MDRADLAGVATGGQRVRDELRGQRFDDVIVEPGLYQIAIEPNVIAVADRDHHNAGFADLGKFVNIRYRQVDAADIDEQDVGRPLKAEGFDRFRNPAAHDRPISVPKLGQTIAQRLLGIGVGNKGQQRRAPGRQLVGRLLDRCLDFENTSHRSPPFAIAQNSLDIF